MSLTPQWDVGNSLLGAASGIRALASVLGKEDVHMEAVIAFDSIGARIMVDDALYGSAVEALNGNESVRLAGMKLFVGLQSGGLLKALRTSASSVRTFLLVAALKGCSYEEQEIADILFEMMRVTKSLFQIPVAPRQLRGIVKAVSGNAERILKSFIYRHTYTVTALARGAVHCTPRSWEKLPEKHMGKLLVNAFGAAESNDYDCTELSGSTGLIHIASIMLWLCPEQTGLFTGETCIVGSEDGKLRIQCAGPSCLGRSGNSDWIAKEWRALKSSTSIICDDPDDEEYIDPHPSTNIIPLGTTRQYYASLTVSLEATDSLGGFAAALLDCMFDHGMVIPYDINTQQPKEQARAMMHERTPLRKLWPSSFLQDLKEPSGLWKSLGWSSVAIEQSRLSIYQDLSTHIKAERADTVKRILRTLSDQDYDEHSNNSEKTAPMAYSGSAVREMFKNAVSKHWQSPGTIEQLLLHVETLVASALLTSQQRPIGELPQYFNPATPGAWIWDAVGPVGAMLPELADLCLKASLNPPTMSSKSESDQPGADLMLASHGRVAFRYVLRGHSCLQEDALAVSVIAGSIQYNDHAYDLVLEVHPTDVSPSSLKRALRHTAIRGLQLAQARPGATQDLSSTPFKLPANANETKLDHHIGGVDRRLYLKTRLSSKPHPDRAAFTQLVSYKATALNIAAAEHMDDEAWRGIHNQDTSVPADFLDKIHIVECECPAREQLEATGVDRVVAMMPHDQAQRFFAADPAFCGLPWERKLRIQQFMPLADCVKIMVEDEGVGSKLITRGAL